MMGRLTRRKKKKEKKKRKKSMQQPRVLESIKSQSMKKRNRHSFLTLHHLFHQTWDGPSLSLGSLIAFYPCPSFLPSLIIESIATPAPLHCFVFFFLCATIEGHWRLSKPLVLNSMNTLDNNMERKEQKSKRETDNTTQLNTTKKTTLVCMMLGRMCTRRKKHRTL